MVFLLREPRIKSFLGALIAAIFLCVFVMHSAWDDGDADAADDGTTVAGTRPAQYDKPMRSPAKNTIAKKIAMKPWRLVNAQRQSNIRKATRARNGTLSHRESASTRPPPQQQQQTWQDCAQFYCKFQSKNGTIFGNVPGIAPADAPLCRDVLMDRLVAFQRAAGSVNLPFYLIFGTLLSQYQSQEIFPWTSDADLAVNTADFDRLLHDWQMIKRLRDQGFIVYRGGERLIRGCFTSPPLNAPVVPAARRAKWQHDFLNTAVYFDLYLEFQPPNARNDEVLLINPSECRFRRSGIYPLRPCALRHQSFSCPKNTERILRRHYGPTFDRPLDNLTQAQVDQFGCPRHHHDK